MALRLPSEIVVDRFLPTVRARLAAELDDRGMTQREIADRLGVTQAAVSKHLAGAVDVETRFVQDPRFERTMARIADGVAEGSMDTYEVLGELMALVRAFEDRGPICAIHEERTPSLEGLGCDLCVRGDDEARAAERAVLADVRRAARRLEGEPRLAAYVPKVGTNVAMALPDAETTRDVAAVPGRIYEARGRVRVPAGPEFGASEHVAGTVLAAAAVDPSVRGGLNIATDDRLLRAARALGVDPIEVDADYDGRLERLRERLAGAAGHGPPWVVYHRGAFGIEPVTYVLHRSASAAAEHAVEMVGRAHDEGDPEDRRGNGDGS